MDRNEQVLSLIGLCLRGRNLEVGEEPVEAVSRARDARVILLASDAAENTARRAEHFAQMGQCILVSVPFTKEELGRAVGRESCALAGVTDVGFACAVARRLADGDPQTYGDAAQRLEVKAQRAAQRRTEQALHEKNLRRGKKRRPGEVKAAVPQEPAEKPVKGSGPSGRKPRAGKPYGGASERKPYSGKPYGKPAGRFSHSRPVKHGKGSFPKKHD